jgi:hypothetical protein
MDEWSIPKQVSAFIFFHLPRLISVFSRKNTRCIMAYIVDLTIILHGLFASARSVSATKVQSAVKDYAGGSSPRNRIHEDIRSFVTLSRTPFFYQGKDTMMEKIIDLIKQNCVLTPSQESR